MLEDTPEGGEPQQLREMREALAASGERFRGVMETAVNAIVIINEQRIMEMVNSATERIFGYTPAELIGKNVSMLMPSPYREQHDGYVNNYLTTGVKKIIGIGREALAQRKDGSIFPMELSVGEVRLRGHHPGFVGPEGAGEKNPPHQRGGAARSGFSAYRARSGVIRR